MASCTDPCTPQPCIDCNASQVALETLCQEGCKEYIPSTCSIFDGPDIAGTNIHNGDNLTKIIQELAAGVLDIDIDLQWNANTRVLALLKNDSTVASVTIADRDDQYLTLSGSTISIWKPKFTGNPDDDIEVNQIDISGVFTETSLSITSESITVTPGGTHGHAPTLEVEPSEDADNALTVGTDGKLYVPQSVAAVSDVGIVDIPGLSWTKEVEDGVITFTPAFDWEYIASQVCPICNPVCITPTGLNVTTI